MAYKNAHFGFVFAMTLVLVLMCGFAKAQNNVAFVTSVTGNGNLHTWSGTGSKYGLEAGDAVCQARALAAGLASPNTFVAWLSDRDHDAYCRIHGFTGKVSANCGQSSLPATAGPWLRVDGLPFADRIDLALESGYRVFTPARLDEAGNTAGHYFTSTSYDGSYYVGAVGMNACLDWTSSSSSYGTTLGSSNSTARSWTLGVIGVPCNTTYRLLCMQTGSGPDLPARAENGGAVFATSVEGNGDLSSWPDAGAATGLAAGDAICRARAVAGGMWNPSSFVAWLSDGTTDAIDRLPIDGPWVRADAVPFAGSNADLISVVLTSSLNVTEQRAYLGYNWTADKVWTGSKKDGSVSFRTCSNWMSSQSSVQGDSGCPACVSSIWSDYGNRDCDESAHLYCFSDSVRCQGNMPISEGQWALISLPCDRLSTATVAEVFGDDGLGVYGTDWAVKERIEASDSYRLLNYNDTVEQGTGYWIKVLSGDHRLEIDGDPTSSDQDFEISLTAQSSPGKWNMVGHPFTFPVNWAEVKVIDNDPPYDTFTLSQTQADTFIQGRWMYKYNGSAYQTYHPDIGSPTLDAFDGFWVRVLGNGSLRIPPTEAVVRSQNQAEPDEWWIQLGIGGGGLHDPENYLGRKPAATDGEDEYDMPELEPPDSAFLTLVFPHSDWSGQWWSYTADIGNSRPGAGGAWSLEVRSDRDREITLSWAIGGNAADILSRSVIIDEQTGVTIRPQSGGLFTASMSAPAHRFTWLVDSVPQVDAGLDRIITTEEPLELTATFTDEDVNDNHTATIDWGDSTIDEAVVTLGTASGSHIYTTSGTFSVEVCVVGELGGSGCDSLTAQVLVPLSHVFSDGFESGDTTKWSTFSR